ncbi:SMP-30/gluconolactonase/LRE family protein [Novosphingobium colocasiae]
MRMGPDGLLYVAQAFGSQISSVDPATGAARVVSAADGAIIAPDDLAFDSHGNLYATEVMSARVSVIRPNGAIDVIAGDVPVANGITVHADRIFMSEFRPEGRDLGTLCRWCRAPPDRVRADDAERAVPGAGRLAVFPAGSVG